MATYMCLCNFYCNVMQSKTFKIFLNQSKIYEQAHKRDINVAFDIANAFLEYCRADIDSKLMENFSTVICLIKSVDPNEDFLPFIKNVNKIFDNETLGGILKVINKI